MALNIILIGFMGVGNQRLAASWHWRPQRFYDIDTLIRKEGHGNLGYFPSEGENISGS